MRFPIPNAAPLLAPLLVAGAALTVPAAACAAGQDALPPGQAAMPEAAAPSAIGQPLADGALDALRGGESLVVVSTRNDGEVNGNHAENVDSGLNAIDGGAFANASGITTVIQNSGSNVLIQNGTAVNVQFVDPVP